MVCVYLINDAINQNKITQTKIKNRLRHKPCSQIKLVLKST